MPVQPLAMRDRVHLSALTGLLRANFVQEKEVHPELLQGVGFDRDPILQGKPQDRTQGPSTKPDVLLRSNLESFIFRIAARSF